MRSASPLCVTVRRRAARSKSSAVTVSVPTNAIRMRFSSDGQSIFGIAKTLNDTPSRPGGTAPAEGGVLIWFDAHPPEQALR